MTDVLAMAANGAIGTVPGLGPFLAEIVEVVIPNQQVDRLAEYAQVLEREISKLQREVVRSRLTDENIVDVEESTRQAAQSLSDERRAYPASCVVNGPTNKDVQFVETKHLLRILGQLNDIQVLILRSFLVPGLHEDAAFRQKHKALIIPPQLTIQSPGGDVDKGAIHTSYLESMASLGLLEPHYRRDSRTGVPVFNRTAGRAEVQQYRIKPLGVLLLGHIGLADRNGRPIEGR